MSPGATIEADDVNAVLPRTSAVSDGPPRLADAVQEFERAQIEDALRATGGNMAQAALRLGLERSHLYKKMKRLGMKVEG